MMPSLAPHFPMTGPPTPAEGPTAGRSSPSAALRPGGRLALSGRRPAGDRVGPSGRKVDVPRTGHCTPRPELGRFGRPFRIYKIRSMTHNCESRSGIQWSTKGDARVTPVGRLLRKTHVDELPQIFNILRGQMSLVGPRPERPELVGVLETSLPRYRERLARPARADRAGPGPTPAGHGPGECSPEARIRPALRGRRVGVDGPAAHGRHRDPRRRAAVRRVPAAYSACPANPRSSPERVVTFDRRPTEYGHRNAIHPIHATHHEVSVDAARA